MSASVGSRICFKRDAIAIMCWTGAHCHAVDMNGAGAALCNAAAEFRASKTQMIAQSPQKWRLCTSFHLHIRAVDSQDESYGCLSGNAGGRHLHRGVAHLTRRPLRCHVLESGINPSVLRLSRAPHESCRTCPSDLTRKSADNPAS